MPWTERREELMADDWVMKTTVWHITEQIMNREAYGTLRSMIATPFDGFEHIANCRPTMDKLGRATTNPRTAAALELLRTHSRVMTRFEMSIDVAGHLDQLIAFSAEGLKKPPSEVEAWTVNVFNAVRELHRLRDSLS